MGRQPSGIDLSASLCVKRDSLRGRDLCLSVCVCPGTDGGGCAMSMALSQVVSTVYIKERFCL